MDGYGVPEGWIHVSRKVPEVQYVPFEIQRGKNAGLNNTIINYKTHPDCNLL